MASLRACRGRPEWLRRRDANPAGAERPEDDDRSLDVMVNALRLCGLSFVGLLGVWLSRHVWFAVRTGSANVHNQTIDRSTRPLYYWVAVVVQAGFAAACFLSVARGLM
jgi:hypothetical protein